MSDHPQSAELQAWLESRRKQDMNHDEEAEAALHEDLKRLRTELPLMRKENRRLTDFLKDAAAFIRIANSGKGAWNSNIVLATLVHDINGLARDEECFQHRVTGYAKREREEQL